MKVVIFLNSSMNVFCKSVIECIRSEKNLEIVGAVIDTKKELSITEKVRNNIKRGRGGYILIMAYHKFFESKEPHFDTKSLMTEWQVPVLEVENPYIQENLCKIKNFKADIGVLFSAFGIVKSPLIRLLEKGILSYHHGNMRFYRGQPPAFWELYYEEREIGVTVQRINRRLDCGEIILEKTFPIHPSDTLASLENKIFQGSQAMMKTALLKVCQPNFFGVNLETFGDVYTLPNLRQWIVFQTKMLKRKYRVGVSRTSGS